MKEKHLKLLFPWYCIPACFLEIILAAADKDYGEVTGHTNHGHQRIKCGTHASQIPYSRPDPA
jgi:hypothetical protein